MEISRIVPWDDVLAYFNEARERAIVDLASANETKDIWKAQGKLDLCNELLNLRSIFETIAEAEQAVPAPDARRVSREAYREQLRGPR